MPGGVSDELAELHARRANAEKEARDTLGLWAFSNLGDVTFGAVRELDRDIGVIISKAVADAYNMGHRHAKAQVAK